MKAFDKWNSEHYFVLPITASTPSSYWIALEERKEIWIAALEWVLNDADSGFCQCGCLEDSIRKELGEENEEL